MKGKKEREIKGERNVDTPYFTVPGTVLTNAEQTTCRAPLTLLQRHRRRELQALFFFV